MILGCGKLARIGERDGADTCTPFSKKPGGGWKWQSGLGRVVDYVTINDGAYVWRGHCGWNITAS